MKKHTHLWTVVAVILIIGGLVWYRQWQMDNLISGLDLDLQDSLLSEVETSGGVDYLVPPSQVFDSGADLPALTDPTFTTVSDADTYLSDAVDGVALDLGGQSYFFSYQILNWHEAVNFTAADTGLVVTHCMLCRSSAVYETQDALSHAGKVYNNNLLLTDDATGSLWNQTTGLAIAGERVGETLTTYPYEVMTWGEWKSDHTSGRVLSNETGYDRDYTRHPFESYDIADIVYFPMNTIDERVASKWIVDGFETGTFSASFPRKIMQGTWVLNFEAEGNRYVAFYNMQTGRTSVFASEDYVFTYDRDADVFMDQDGGTWSADGVALSGAARGSQLEQQRTSSMFSMCWYANHTDTLVSFIDLMNDDGTAASEDVEATE